MQNQSGEEQHDRGAKQNLRRRVVLKEHPLQPETLADNPPDDQNQYAHQHEMEGVAEAPENEISDGPDAAKLKIPDQQGKADTEKCPANIHRATTFLDLAVSSMARFYIRHTPRACSQATGNSVASSGPCEKSQPEFATTGTMLMMFLNRQSTTSETIPWESVIK